MHGACATSNTSLVIKRGWALKETNGTVSGQPVADGRQSTLCVQPDECRQVIGRLALRGADHCRI
jgi:hypothetical protein